MTSGRTGRRLRSGGVALALAAVAALAAACNGPFGPSTAPGPIVGTLTPLVVSGVPEPTATVHARGVCTPDGGASTVTVTIEHNEHPVEVRIIHSWPEVPEVAAMVEPGGGTVELLASDQCWHVAITHLDLGTTGDDLDYRIDWVPISNH